MWFLFTGFVWLAGDSRHGNNAFHGACVRKLRHAGNDIANGVNAFFASFHPFIGVNKAALHFDAGRFLQANAFSVRAAAHGDQNFFRFQLLRGFAVRREAYGDAILWSSQLFLPWY